MDVYFDPLAEKQLRKLDPPLQKRILRRVALLEDDQIEIKWLRYDRKKQGSVRVGKYRLVLEEEKPSRVHVRFLDHRQDAYKN